MVLETTEDCGVSDLISVEVKYGQHRPIAHRVQELVGMPARCQRSRFCLTVTHYATHQQVGIIEGSTEGMGDRVAQFAALVDRPRGLWRDVARNPAGKRKLPEELLYPFGVAGHARVELG